MIGLKRPEVNLINAGFSVFFAAAFCHPEAPPGGEEDLPDGSADEDEEEDDEDEEESFGEVIDWRSEPGPSYSSVSHMRNEASRAVA